MFFNQGAMETEPDSDELLLEISEAFVKRDPNIAERAAHEAIKLRDTGKTLQFYDSTCKIGFILKYLIDR